MDDIVPLLRADDDNKKFMGLMLATMLPRDEAILTAVYDAVGMEFINRLILGLSSKGIQDTARSHAQQEVSEGSAALGLAVIGTLSSVPEIAASPEFMSITPLLLNVLRNRGTDRIFAVSSAPASGSASDAAALESAVSGLTRVAETSQHAREVAMESGAIHAILDALQDDIVSKNANNCRLVVSYLSSLLTGRVSEAALQEHDVILSQCVVPLAELLARPHVSLATQPQLQQQQQQTRGRHAEQPGAGAPDVESDSCPAAEDAMPQETELPKALSALELQQTADIHGDDSSHSGGKGCNVKLDPSDEKQLKGALQLEVMHALLLLLLLPLPLEGSLRAQYLGSSGGVKVTAWPRDVLCGLVAIMTAVVPPQTRQAALMLLARLTDVIGPLCLLSSEPVKGVKGGFYQLCLELAAVEVQVLLVEALRPPSTTTTPGQQEREQVLVSCFNVLEGLVAALAADDDVVQESPLASEGVMWRVMGAMDEAFQPILEFLEVALQPEGIGDSLVVLAALKCLGRYLGQLPNAFTSRVRAALPQLLAVKGGSDMPAGSSSNSLALQFLLPQLQQCVAGTPETAVPSIGLETSAWLATLRQPTVIQLMARGAEGLASQAITDDVLAAALGTNPEMGRPGVEAAMDNLAEFCTMMLTVAFDSRDSDRDSAFCVEPDSQRELLSLVKVLCSQLAHVNDGGSAPVAAGRLPMCAGVRCIVASAAFAAAVLAEIPAEEMPVGSETLLAVAFDVGFDVGRCLHRPPDLEQGGVPQSDTDDLFAELTDEVQDWWFGMLPNVTALVKRGPGVDRPDALLHALQSKGSVQKLLEANEEELQALVGNSLTRSSPVSELLEALRSTAAAELKV